MSLMNIPVNFVMESNIRHPSSYLPAAEPDAVLGVPALLVVVHALRKLVLKQTKVQSSGCLSVFLHLNLTSFTEYSIFWCRITFSLCSVDLFAHKHRKSSKAVMPRKRVRIQSQMTSVRSYLIFGSLSTPSLGLPH